MSQYVQTFPPASVRNFLAFLLWLGQPPRHITAPLGPAPGLKGRDRNLRSADRESVRFPKRRKGEKPYDTRTRFPKLKDITVRRHHLHV